MPVVSSWKSIGEIHYTLFGQHDIMITRTTTGIQMRAIQFIVLNSAQAPLGPNPTSTVPFLIPSVMNQVQEPIYSTNKYDTSAGSAMGPMTVNFGGPMFKAFGWSTLGIWQVPARFDRPGCATPVKWAELPAWFFMKPNGGGFPISGMSGDLYQMKSFANTFHTIGGPASYPSLPGGIQNYCIALTNPSFVLTYNNVGNPVEYPAAPSPPAGKYIAAKFTSYPMSLGPGLTWSPGDPLPNVPYLAPWGGSFATPGIHAIWNNGCAKVPNTRPPMQFRLAGGAKKISGVSGGTPYTVEDVTEIYKSQLVGFPYPVTDMASGKQLTFGVDYDNSVFVARVGFQPAAPVNVEVRGGFKYDGETLKAIGYYKTTVPLTEVKLATIKLPLDGGWPTWQGP